MEQSPKLDARSAASQSAKRLKSKQPSLGWQFELDAVPPALRIGNRLIATFEDTGDGVVARMREPSQPGDDNHPVLLHWPHEVEDFAWDLEIAASDLGKMTIHGLRRNAVYEVKRDFTDLIGRAFQAGSRMTYLDQSYSAHDSLYALRFVEGVVCLDPGDRFGDYLGFPGDAETS